MSNDIGKDAEDLVQSICIKMFLPDLVVRNPKFKKSSGLEHEIADTLVMFKDQLLCFQVKAKRETKKASNKNHTDMQRIEKRIAEGVKQVSVINTALKLNDSIKLTNSIDIEFEIQSNSIKKIIGIVIVDLVGEELFPEEERSEILGGFEQKNNIPVHIFMREDLELIASEIDTLPDFLKFLDTRETLYYKGILMPYVSERDFLACYKMSPEIIEQAINDHTHFMITEGWWNNYVQNYKDQINQRNIDNQPSYYIDEIISWFHTSIGYINTEINVSLDQQGTKENYIAAICELSAYSRLERRTMGIKYLDCLMRADEKGHAHSLMLDLEDTSGFLIVSTNSPRESRFKALTNIAAMAYCSKGLKKICVLATEGLRATSRSYDFFIMENATFEKEKEIIEKAKGAFGDPKHYHLTDYNDKSNKPV